MAKFASFKIGVRLGAGFGVVLLLMVMLIVVGLIRLAHIVEITDYIIHNEWAKSDAAQVVNARTRADACATLRLFIKSDKDKVAALYREIDSNKAVIDDARDRLDSSVHHIRGCHPLAQTASWADALLFTLPCLHPRH